MRKLLLPSSTALMTLIISAPVAAQTPEPSAQPAAQQTSDATGAGLQDIIVTAQRRSESLQRAAIAVDVVTAGELKAAGVVTATTLNAAVPSLTVQQGGGANNVFFIRGVGNFTLNGYSDPAIAFNLDGVYLGRPTSTTTTFFDLERIEVLKGPQGTLYGRNATGGAVNVIPAKPKLGELSAALSAGYGNYNAKDFEAIINVPLGTTAALRVSGKVVDRDGYNRDGTLDDKGRGVRVQLLVEPNDRLNFRLAADYSHQGGAGPGGSYLGVENYSPGARATATSPANYSYSPANVDPFSGLASREGAAFFARQVIAGPSINPAPLSYPSLNNGYWGALAEVNWKTDAGTLTVLPSYRESQLNVNFNGPSFRGGLSKETDRQFSLEVRFAGRRIGPFDWLIGGYYFDESVAAQYGFNQYAIVSFQDFASHTKSYAGFGRFTAHLTDRLRLVGGGRYTVDDKSFNATAQTLVEICVVPTGCLGGPSFPVVQRLDQVPNGPTIPGVPVPFGTNGNLALFFPLTVDRATSNGRLTYRAAAEYDLAPNSLLYASYETGYRSGGFSIAVGKEEFQPEYVDAITLGSKNRFFGNKVQLNIEAFYWKYRNQQVSHLGLDGQNNSGFFTENIGRSTLQGVDVESQVLVTHTTRLNATLQYLDSKADSFIYNVPRAGSIPPATGCPVTAATDANAQPIYAVNCSGRPAFNSPRWSLNGGVEQSIPMGGYKLVLTGAARYRSNAVIGFEYLPQMNSGNNTTFDAAISFGETGGRWSVDAFVRNLTDERIKSFVQYGGASGGTLSAIYAPPRTYGARLAYKF